MWATEIVCYVLTLKQKIMLTLMGFFLKCITDAPPILRVCGTIIIVDMYDDNHY